MLALKFLPFVLLLFVNLSSGDHAFVGEKCYTANESRFSHDVCAINVNDLFCTAINESQLVESKLIEHKSPENLIGEGSEAEIVEDPSPWKFYFIFEFTGFGSQEKELTGDLPQIDPTDDLLLSNLTEGRLQLNLSEDPLPVNENSFLIIVSEELALANLTEDLEKEADESLVAIATEDQAPMNLTGDVSSPDLNAPSVPTNDSSKSIKRKCPLMDALVFFVLFFLGLARVAFLMVFGFLLFKTYSRTPSEGAEDNREVQQSTVKVEQAPVDAVDDELDILEAKQLLAIKGLEELFTIGASTDSEDISESHA